MKTVKVSFQLMTNITIKVPTMVTILLIRNVKFYEKAVLAWLMSPWIRLSKAPDLLTSKKFTSLFMNAVNTSVLKSIESRY